MTEKDIELSDELKDQLETWEEFKEAKDAGMSKEELRAAYEEELGWFDCTACDWHGATAPMAEDWSVDRFVECPECGGDVT